MSEDSNATATPAEPILPASYQASTINNRRFTLRQRCLACTLRHYGSDDPDKCPHRGDAFRPDWMNMRTRKHNADHGSSSTKPLSFLLLPPMSPTIIKSTLQSNEANHGSHPIFMHDQDEATNEQMIGEKLLPTNPLLTGN